MVYKYVSVSIGENQRFLIPLLVRTYLCKSCRPQRKAVVPVGKHLKCICGANGVRLKKNRRKTQSQAIQFESKPIRFRWPLETSLAKAYWIIFDLIFVTNAVWIPLATPTLPHSIHDLITWFYLIFHFMTDYVPMLAKTPKRRQNVLNYCEDFIYHLAVINGLLDVFFWLPDH